MVMSMPSFEAVDTWLEHIRVIAEDIGPRGSTTENERRAAEYCADVYNDLDLEPQTEQFRSATSLFLLHAYVGTTMLLSFIVYPLAGRISAALALVLAFIGLYSETMELLFRNNPLRRLLPRGDSQNVIATLDPAAEHKQDLILMGHLDSNHTPIIFRSVRWVNFWRLASSIIFQGFVIQLILYSVGFITQAAIIWWLSIPCAVGSLVLMFFTYEGELTPFSHGANDNATAAAILLTLAEQLQLQPLQHTRVWFVNTGCEEVKHYGAIDFYNRHQHEFVNPHALVFEMLGRDGPGWLVKEGTISIFNYRASPEMIKLAVQVAQEHPDLGGHPTQVDGGHTEMADALRIDIPAITLIGLDEGGTRYNYDGTELYWHQKGDTVDKLLPDVLERNYAFTWEFIRALDASAYVTLSR